MMVGAGKNQPGFFVRYDYASTIDVVVPPYQEVEQLFAEKRDDFVSVIEGFERTLPQLMRAVEAGKVPWEQDGMFPVLDVLAAYCIVRQIQPKRIIEIGSGASTHVLSRALSDNEIGELFCIDPVPRRSISETSAVVEKRILRNDDAKLVEKFEPNDVLFIDSSHLMFPGMDVDIQFNRMFPKLPAGAIVHVHDIFLPDGYPSDWQNRYYSEQNALIGWIMSGFFDVVYPSFYAATRLEDQLAAVLGDKMPAAPSRNAGSIWLRRSGSNNSTPK